MDLVSSYIWRGVYEAGPSLQPGLTLGIGNFTIAAWGSVDFTSSSYKEADLMLSYRLKTSPSTSKTFTTKVRPRTGIRRSAATTSISAPTPRTASKPASNGRYRAKSPSRSPGTRSFRSARCRYPGAAVLLLIRRSSLSLYGQNHRPENGRRSRALENGRRGRSQRFCRENVFINAGKLWAVKAWVPSESDSSPISPGVRSKRT